MEKLNTSDILVLPLTKSQPASVVCLGNSCGGVGPYNYLQGGGDKSRLMFNK